MSDHALGLLGLAITIIALVAPYRWPKVYRGLTDIGLLLGWSMAIVAFSPIWEPIFNPPPTPLVQVAPATPPAAEGLSRDQQEIQSLRRQLAAAKSEADKTKDLLAMNDAVQGWGIMNPNTFYMSVDASKFSKYKGKLKLMMIVRIPYSNIDRMSDTHIAKSQFYSVSNAIVTLTREGLSNLQITPQETMVEFDLVGFPQGFINAEKIASLGDLEGLGGVILTVKASSVSKVRPTSVASACPK